ncbi:MAG: IS1595 family transposase [Gammaproteobacteria bacterium]|nr:IS1595 family transposase [Gammaproteobacteria bacterium]
MNTKEAPNAKPMPYWRPDCRSYFSVRTETAIARSNVPLRKWAIAIYLCVTSLKSVSRMKLHRDLGVSQKTAWFMLHRLREAWAQESDGPFQGPAEVDESYFGGRRKNMSNARRKALADTGRGSVGKTAVVGAKDRASNRVSARVVQSTRCGCGSESDGETTSLREADQGQRPAIGRPAVKTVARQWLIA